MKRHLNELTQEEFNRLADFRDSYRARTAITPSEKNDLYADIKDFQEEFEDLKATAERLPDEYIGQVCNTASYPFDDVIDEVDDVEDWCQEAEEFLKNDIASWGVMKEASNAATRRYAKARHDRTGAIRKSSGKPYFVHPDGVAQIVMVYGGTDAQIQAAYLHDTMEDTGETADHIAELFGEDVASIVSEITNDPWEVRRIGKENYISKELCELSHDALLVKLSDMYYNQKDYPKPGQAERQIRNIRYLLANRSDLLDNELDLIEDILGELIL